ncbi:DUF881 domain-containing protein [Nocardioides sp.]|uniref:DUF881 domain-containing protein n=1 Tax=Nocardioides sp. TaxID=35761 RepID=UPI002735F9A5|nr:DUF881 domain-containing protein [Nocardioides sp.]MDP3892176.1 DUF881 domain-containing protein [Nocardioides sp.]
MTHGSHERPHPRRSWRVGTPVVFLLSGALFAVSAANSDGTDLRPGRYNDLASLVSNESEEVEALTQRVADLTNEVNALTQGLGDRKVRRIQAEIETMRDPAGLTPHRGEGVTVTLSDAPREVIESSERDVNLLIVHQQDIQAVVNAMWKGGARAVTIQGQRIVTTTGIKCEGNAVQLQGVPYSQPYVIQAVGDQDELLEAIDTDRYVSVYRSQAEVADIAVGWSLEPEDDLTAPPYEGLLDLNYAQPL